jgi:hypothetical protein
LPNHHNLHILAIALDPLDPDSVLASFSESGEVSPTMSCSKARVADVVASIHRDALAQEAQLVVAFLRQRRRSSTEEVDVELRLADAVLHARESTPTTHRYFVGKVPHLVPRLSHLPRLELLTLPWARTLTVDHINAAFATLPFSEELLGHETEPSNRQQWHGVA